MFVIESLSTLFGMKSTPAKFVNIVGFNIINLIYAVVAVGYISQLFIALFTQMPAYLGAYIAIGFLVCAAPFEIMTSAAENSDTMTKHGLGITASNHVLYYLLALSLSLLGSIQFFIRNYVLMQNFALTSVATRIYALTEHLAFSQLVPLLGASLGMLTHFLVSYINWDKLGMIDSKRSQEPIGWLEFSFVFAAVAFFSLFSWGQFVLTAALSGYLVYQIWNVGRYDFGVEDTAVQEMPSLVVYLLSVMLPIGATLYTLVDFFNAYSVLSTLGYMSSFALGGCALLGVLSWVQKVQVWGRNLCVNAHDSDRPVKIDHRYPILSRLFYYKPSSRKALNLVRELALTVLDFFNNMFSYAFINELAILLTGFSVSIGFLHLCTLASLANRLVIFHLQSPKDEAIVSDSFDRWAMTTNPQQIGKNENQTKKYNPSRG